jgi:hypothetical protein
MSKYVGVSKNSRNSAVKLKDLSTVPSSLAPEVCAFCMRVLTVLPCLETLLESLLWYGVQAGCGKAFNVFKCCKTLTTKLHFWSREQQKVTGYEVW